MLGLVLGPGEVLGVGLVVLGVSVPMPPADDPEDEVPEDEVPDESEGMPEEVPDEFWVPDPLLPTLDPSAGFVELTPVPPVDVPALGFAGDVSRFPIFDVPVIPAPELSLVPELLVPEPPPVMPAHAPSSIAQAIGNIHFVIDHSRKFQKPVRTRARSGRLHCKCRE